MGGRRLTYSIVTEAPAVPAGDVHLHAGDGSGRRPAAAASGPGPFRRSIVYLVPTVALVAATVAVTWPGDEATPPQPAAQQLAAPAESAERVAAMSAPSPKIPAVAVAAALTVAWNAGPGAVETSAAPSMPEPAPAGEEASTAAASGTADVAAAAPVVFAALPPAGLEVPEAATPADAALIELPDRDDAPDADATPGELAERSVRLQRGDTLMSVLTDAGVSRQIAHLAITALRGVFDPRKFRTGQEIVLSFATDESSRFLGLRFDPEAERTVSVTRRDDDRFTADEAEKILSADLVRGAGTITSSLIEAGGEAGVPTPVMFQLIQLYSFDVDFQRDIWAGDSFEVMFENYHDESDQVLSHGDILYASLTLRGQTLRLYRFTPASGRTDYFNEQGESTRKMLMRTPIDGARLSSRFGTRRHPILGYTRMHRGIDFAAPRGTPIYAAGDGTVTIAGRNGGYGRYIEIRHNSTYSTAYAHLHRIADSVRSGIRVRQGQVIGYVGSTGRSTGPHLHYEIHRNGKSINPLTLRMAGGEKLEGKDFQTFASVRREIDARYASLARDLQVAQDDRKEEHACASPTDQRADEATATC